MQPELMWFTPSFSLLYWLYNITSNRHNHWFKNDSYWIRRKVMLETNVALLNATAKASTHILAWKWRSCIQEEMIQLTKFKKKHFNQFIWQVSKYDTLYTRFPSINLPSIYSKFYDCGYICWNVFLYKKYIFRWNRRNVQ